MGVIKLFFVGVCACARACACEHVHVRACTCVHVYVRLLFECEYPTSPCAEHGHVPTILLLPL
jgi:hypothetical protein